MNSSNDASKALFSLSGKVVIVTGGTGVLGGTIARGLAEQGAKVVVLGRREEKAKEVAEEIENSGGMAMPLTADVLDRTALESARETVLNHWDRIDVLVNAAGGNVSRATVGDKQSFFDLPKEALGEVFDLNLLGTVLPIQVFGESMVESKEPGWAEGSIVNVSSMTAQRPLTGVVGYSAAKAAVENLTRWLATNLARRYGSGMRVNAVAPGFFLGEQNRAMLVNEDGSLTGRGEKIIEHTPAGRFGEPEELVGAVVWLCSPAATFVNGAVIPIDGGFGAFSGV